MTNTNEKAMWSCMVGEVDRSVLPSGSDGPMREAVAAAYRRLTGRDDLFIFSGWGDQLDEAHRAVVENREPDHYKIRDDLAERLGQCEQFIAHLGADVEALPETTPVDQERLYATSDALVWADEFGKVCPDVDAGLMISWFANAMQTAINLHDRSKAASQRPISGEEGDSAT